MEITKEQKLILLSLVASIVVGLGVMVGRQYIGQNNQSIEIETPKEAVAVNDCILVHINGAVKREGVYRLKNGDRLIEAVNQAGGVTGTADLSSLNLAEILKDGQKVIVPQRQPVEEPELETPSRRVEARAKGKVNLNTADEKILDALPGVGPQTAQAIVQYRRDKGPFTSPEQLKQLPRFGKAKYERLKDKITI